MPFAPSDLDNLWAWYKSNVGVATTGSDVNTWADQSGNGRDLTAASGKEPILEASVLNSLPIIKQGTGWDAEMTTSGNFPNPFSGLTVYLVASQKSDEASINFDAGGAFIGAGSETNFQITRSGSNIRGGVNTSAANSANLAATDNTFYTIRLRYDGTQMHLSLNNGAENTVSPSGGSGYIATPLKIFKTLTAPLGDKRIAEIIIYTENHPSGNDRDLVEYYLQQRYNHYTWTGDIPESDVQAVITFNALPTKTVGDADFAPGATSNSPATINYESSNTSVATIVSGNIHIVGAGTTNITASQDATDGYTAAEDVIQSLTVNAQILNAMPNVDNSIQGGLMELWLREAGTSDPRQLLICYLDIPLQITNEVNEKDSSCGTHVRVKDGKGTISGNAVVNTAPSETEVSYDQFVSWQLNKTVLEYEYQNGEDTINGTAVEAGELIRFVGNATIIDSTLTPTVGEAVEFSFQLKLNSITKELES